MKRGLRILTSIAFFILALLFAVRAEPFGMIGAILICVGAWPE